MIHWLKTILHGIGIGAANVIPGVSGGTMALIFGIYERLIGVAEAAVSCGLRLFKLDFSGFWNDFRALPWTFILPLLGGIVIAPLAGARYIPTLLETYPESSRALFFGLMLGSVAIPWFRIRSVSASHWAAAAIAAAVAFALAGFPPAETADPSAIFLFVAGAIAMSAMILPGVSGAYLLLVLGVYAPILRAVDERTMGPILIFMVGAAAGLAAFSLFIGWLLRRAHDHTMAVLVGLMVGSLRALWPWLGEGRELEWARSTDSVPVVMGFLVLGLAVSVAVLLWERRNRSLASPTPLPDNDEGQAL